MRETGIIRREENVWIIKKPKCLLSSRVVSVGNNQLFLVYLILVCGNFLSIVIFVIEVLWHKFQDNNFLL